MASGKLSLLRQEELVDLRCDQLRALQIISSALQSTFDLPHLLELIVDCAKQLTQTEKAILQLVSEKSPSFELDPTTVVVRGCRSEHPERWWRKQLESVAYKVIKEGKPVMISPGRGKQDRISSMVCVPLKIRGRSIGILSALNPYPSSFSEEDVILLTIVAGQAAIAIENAKLFAKNKELVIAVERERIANELHDGIAQSIYNVILSLQVCQRLISPGNRDVLTRIKRSHELARKSLEEVRQCVYNLRPSELERRELVTACKQYLKSIERTSSFSICFAVSGLKRNLSLPIEKAVYRLVQEGITNIAKHAQATQAEVKLRFFKKKLILTINDNGQGFNASKALARARRKGKLGLASMKQRVTELNGEFTIVSRQGSGTKLRAEIPYGL